MRTERYVTWFELTPVTTSLRERMDCMSKAPLALVLAVTALVGPGCGDDGRDSPPDFAVAVSHADGSVPPPFHAEWDLTVDRRGRGLIVYVPDYPGKGVPRYRVRFKADAGELDRLRESLREEGLLEGDIEEADGPPVGGDVDTATFTADGESFKVPAFSAEGEPSLATVMKQIRGVVPAGVWRNFAERRRAYATKRYGRAP